MRLLRIEDANFRGPYCSGSYEWRDGYCFDGPQHPCADEDRLLRGAWDRVCSVENLHKNYRFSFRDEEQLLAWFHERNWLEGLAREGFCVREYEVRTALTNTLDSDYMRLNSYYLGDKQCIFHTAYAERVGVVAWEDLLTQLEGLSLNP